MKERAGWADGFGEHDETNERRKGSHDTLIKTEFPFRRAIAFYDSHKIQRTFYTISALAAYVIKLVWACNKRLLLALPYPFSVIEPYGRDELIIQTDFFAAGHVSRFDNVTPTIK